MLGKLLVVFIAAVSIPVQALEPGQAPFLADVKAELTDRVIAAYPDAEVEITVHVPTLKLLTSRGCLDSQYEITAKQITGRIPVRIHCQNAKPWSFYLQAEVSAQQEVLVAKHNLLRGEPLGKDNLTRARLPIEPGAFTHLSEVTGFTTKRAIRQGRLIRLNDLVRPHAVKKGDIVTIQARHGGAFITSSGVALRSGHVGDQISVRNSASKRVVHPWVVKSGVVATAR